jgi:hypothetical protein
MTRQQVNGLLFFRGEARTCVGYNVNQTGARLYSDGLGLIPIDFYVSFDDLRTVGKCQLASRYRDDISVVFERWLDFDAKNFSIHYHRNQIVHPRETGGEIGSHHRG